MAITRNVAVQERHLSNILRWVNDPDLRPRIGTIRPVSELEHREYFERTLKDATRVFFAVEEVATGRHVGMAGLCDIDLTTRDAELWMYIGEPELWGKGHARDAFRHTLAYAFETLGLHRVSASVFEFNERAAGFFAAMGMRLEGRRREAVFRRGRRWDLLRLGILAREFLASAQSDDQLPAIEPLTAQHPTAQQVLEANRVFHSRLAEHFLEVQPYGSAENRARVRQVLERVAAKAGGGRLLDVGCGTGFVLDLAHDLFRDIEGVDPTAEMLEHVIPRPNVKVRSGVVEKLPFADAAFDAVTAYGVLHHLFDLAIAFAEIRRVLRPGGVFYADESPSHDFAAAMGSLDTAHLPSEIVQREQRSVVGDARVYQQVYGLDESVVTTAMFQAKVRGGLRTAELEHLLRQAGFVKVSIRPRWFAGQGTVGQTQGDDVASLIDAYLVSVLPVSRPLFKYVMIEAEAGPASRG